MGEIAELKALNLELYQRFEKAAEGQTAGSEEQCALLTGQLTEWQQWGEAKTQEYNLLLEAYNGYVEAHTNQALEITSLKETHGHLSEEVDKLKASVEAKEVEIRDLSSVQQSAIQQSIPEEKGNESPPVV